MGTDTATHHLRSLTSMGVSAEQATRAAQAMADALPPVEVLRGMWREAILNRYPVLRVAPFLVDWWVRRT